MYLSDCPDEVLCQIFQYLNSFEALYSLMNLNSRFNSLLIPFKKRIDLTHVSYQQFMDYVNNLLPVINKDEALYSIKIGNARTPGEIELFNKLMNNRNYRNYFNNIHEVVIESPRLDELTNFVEKFLLSLPALVSLSLTVDNIHDEDFQTWTKLFVHSILPISTLVKLSIEMPTGLVLSHLPDTIMFDSLVKLTLNVTLVTDLLILIQHIRNVEYLTIRIGWWTSGDRTLVKMLNEMRSNNNQASLLNCLKSFHLTVDSVLTFQFEHLEQVLYRILNNKTTRRFSFVLRQYLHRQSEFPELINGNQWERLLLPYSSLNEFNLFIRIAGSFQIEQEKPTINSFQSSYFLSKGWLFSCFAHTSRDNLIFYSIPYKNKELFDITLTNEEVFINFPNNYASTLLIDQQDRTQTDLNQSNFNFVLQHFPSVQELRLAHVQMNFLISSPINIPSLHTLKIEKEHINISTVLSLLPLINTLYMSYYSVNNSSGPFYSTNQYSRIRDLSVSDIPADNINQVKLFLTHFTNLRYLHLHLYNHRVAEEYLLTNLHNIIQELHSIVYLKLQLEKTINSSVDWKSLWNGRVKMYSTETIFSGILVHLWF